MERLEASSGRREDFPWSVALFCGAILSALTLGHPYSYCVDGPARGLPFPVLRPAHELNVASVFVGAIERVPSEVHLPGFATNLLIWTAVGALGLFVFRYLRHRS